LLPLVLALSGCGSAPPADGDELASRVAREWVTPPVRAPGVRQVVFTSTAAHVRVSYHIFLPAQYDAEPARRFPVLYWLHGSGGGLAGIPQLAAHFNAAIRAGKIPPMLVAFPNGHAASMWCDSQDGRVPMETVVMREVLPHVDASFRTMAVRDGRILEGFSMGGYGAARLAFKYPDMFRAVSILAGGPLDPEFEGPRATARPEERQRILVSVYGNDMACYRAQSPWMLAGQHAAAIRDRVRIRIVAGSRDFTMPLNRRFAERLRELGIPHTLTILPDVDHSPRAVLSALGDAGWTFYLPAVP
jgi:S-formylglutathione hydrolase FrmB